MNIPVPDPEPVRSCDMTLTLWMVSLAVAALTVADQARRSASAWTAVDRDRGTWVTCTVIGGLVFLGPVAALAYAIGVVPRFGHADGAAEEARRPPLPPPSTAPAAASAPAARRHVAPERLLVGQRPIVNRRA